MLERIFFLSSCFISLVCFELLDKPTPKEGIESQLRERSTLLEEESLRALEFADKETRPFLKRLRDNCAPPITPSWWNSPRTNYFTPEKRTEIKNNWIKNQEKVVSIYQDSKELSEIHSELKNELWTSVLANLHNLFHFIRWNTGAIKALRKFDDWLAFLKQVRLLELGDIELPTSNSNLMTLLLSHEENPEMRINPDNLELPTDIVSLIAKNTWRKIGEIMVDELKKLIINNAPFFQSSNRDQWLVLLWWKHTFKMVDLLLKNEFLDQNIVRIFFQDPNVMDKLLIYTAYRFDHDIEESISYGSPQLTKHWYWPQLHECFQALTKKEETLLQGHLLLQTRFQAINDLIKENDEHATPWMDLLFSERDPFDPSKYLELLRSDSKLLTSQAQDMIYRDVARIIQLIAVPGEGFQYKLPAEQMIILYYFCDVLDLIDEFISPGIRNEILATHQSLGHFENRYRPIKLNCQMNDISWKANQFFRYVRKKSPNDWFKSTSYKSTFNEFITQLIEKLDDFKKEALRVTKKLQHLEHHSAYLNSLNKNEVIFEKSVTTLRGKLKAFN